MFLNYDSVVMFYLYGEALSHAILRWM